MKSFIAITLTVTAVAYAQQTPPVWGSCTPATVTPQFDVTSFSASPYPFCVGKEVCGTITGKLSAPIVEGAHLTIIGKYLGNTVYNDEADFCALLAAKGTPCPVPISTTSITACITVKPNTPADIPGIDYVSVSNGDGGHLFCQTATTVTTNCAA